MRKKCELLCFFCFFCFLSFLSIEKVNAANTFQCNYTVGSDSLKAAREGNLTCTFGYDSFLFIKKAILDCEWNTNGVNIWVIEDGAENWDLISYLKEQNNTCPRYVAIETSTYNFETWDNFATGVHAYFSNNYSDVQKESENHGKYYTVGVYENAENSEKQEMMCGMYTEDYYNEFFLKFENELLAFYDDNCDDFSLTEEEKNSVASIESIKEYKKCISHLTYSESFFNEQIESLKNAYKTYNCFNEEEYYYYLDKLSHYKNTYNQLKVNLTEQFNGVENPIEDGDLSEESEENNNGSAIDNNPDYNIKDTSVENICSMPSYRKPMKFVGTIINFVKIIIPIIIIGFGVMDLYKAITGSKDDEIKKSIKSIIIRVIAGICMFLLPGIIQFILNMVNEWSNYKNSWCCCTDCLLNSNCDVNSCDSNSCKIEGMN